MDKDNLRLNNFILWCKCWYVPTDPEMGLFEQVKGVLYLDGYTLVKTMDGAIAVVLQFMDDMVDTGLIKPIKMYVFYSNVKRNEGLFGLSEEEAILWTVRDILAFGLGKDKVTLKPPVYSRKTFRLGFVGPSMYGNSYKMLNHKTRKFFNA